MTTLLTPAEELGATSQERIFEQEFLPLMDALYGYANRLTNDATRAEDLVQDTYAKAWRAIDSYTEGTNAKAWLFRICKHAFINEYRTLCRQPRKVDYEEIVVFHNEDESCVQQYAGLREESGDQFYGDEVLKAIESLPEVFRDVLLLDLEDFSYDEIAKLVESPIGTVRSRLHRARGLMAEYLRDYARGYGYGTKDDNCQRPNETATSTEGNQGEVAAPAASSIPLK